MTYRYDATPLPAPCIADGVICPLGMEPWDWFVYNMLVNAGTWLVLVQFALVRVRSA